ncbi:MAG TPA: DUF192 domain-containing protein [Desulfobacterales bacterium]|nr:DUF192 domain-containing protein [Desulfobacterales bacterium]
MDGLSPFAAARVAGGLMLLAICLAATAPLAGAAAGILRPDGVAEFLRPDGAPRASLAVEIAETPESRARGLMGRALPDYLGGMLFIFETAEIQTFWMRNTPGSLDMIFVDAAGTVLNVAAATTPMSDQTYSSSGPARYVVEARAGFAERFGIRRGDALRWRRLK